MTENDIISLYPNSTYSSVGSGYIVKNDYYNIYIPKNFDSSTPSILSYHGTDTAYGAPAAEPYLTQNDTNKIIVFPIGGYSYWEDDQTNQNMNQIVNNIYQYKGYSNPGTSGSVGFSAGDGIAVNEYVQTLKAHPDSIPYPCVLIDPAYSGKQLNNPGIISDEDYAYLASRNAMFVAFEENVSESYDADAIYNYTEICKKGVNVLVFWSDGDHGLQRDKAIGTCAYDLASGDFDKINKLEGDVSFIGYNGLNTLKGYNNIQYYDKNTKSFRNVTIDEAFSLLCENCNYLYGVTNSIDGIHILDKIYKDLNKLGEFSLEFADNMDEQIKSYYEYLIEQMNKFRVAIRDTASLDGLGELGFTSSTKSHELANNCIQQYYKGAFDLLRKVSDETVAAVNVGINFDNADVKLSRLSDDLTEIGDPYSVNYNNVALKSPSLPQSPNSISGNNSSAPSVNPNSEILESLSDDDTENNKNDNNKYNFDNEFYKFENLSSNNDLIVYEKEKDCKLIIHKDQSNKIVGLEHYYSLNDSENVEQKVIELKDKYKENIFLDKIVTKDNKIKVIFKNNYYENKSVNDLRSIYSDLKEITEEKI